MKKIQCTQCGGTEFITQPNKYDVYEVVDGELQYVNTESIDDMDVFYCRECGEILKTI
ncbi:MAG: hypothetical protein J5606_02260 [Bacteroidales bacterium]|nr:hypothetical protein [Bacteroidales bacterium]